MKSRLAGVAALPLVALLCGCTAPGDGERPAAGERTGKPLVATPGSADGASVELYFPDEHGTLSAEARQLAPWTAPGEGARSLLEALLAGPQSEALSAPLPPGTSLGTVHLSAAGLLYVDLLSSEHPRPPLSGSSAELTAVYSLVDSVLLNLPEIRGVVLLWNGRQLPTFAGHVDTSLPLRADADLLARRR